jgi:hypothetical protein
LFLCVVRTRNRQIFDIAHSVANILAQRICSSLNMTRNDNDQFLMNLQTHSGIFDRILRQESEQLREIYEIISNKITDRIKIKIKIKIIKAKVKIAKNKK